MQQQTSTRIVARPWLAHRIILSIETWQLILGLIIIFVVTTLGLLLALQGWKSRVPAFDMLTYFNSGEHLLKTGEPAQFGDVSSYGSFHPPGPTWLMAPGMLLLNDPRLYEKFGSGLLYLGTLLGVFLLARSVLGIKCAFVSVALYGLSGLGLAFAGSLWPIGHPFFYVWMVYWSVQWVSRNDARYLAAAIGTWTFGMYDAMAITPAVLILPMIWFLYHPPIFSKMLIIAGILTLALWYPYLEFEMSRGFADLQSQFLLRNIFPANYSSAWCDPNLKLSEIESSTLATPESNSPLNIADRFFKRLTVLRNGLVVNFQSTPLRGVDVGLLLAFVASCIALGFSKHRQAHVLLLGMMVPWLILLAVAEPDRPERFFWLFPLQAILLAAFVTNVLARKNFASPLVGSSLILLFIAVCAQPIQAHLESWMKNGWAGVDAEQMQVVDFVTNQVRFEGRNQAAIGYQIFIYEFMPRYHVIDPEYKVGAEFDFLLKHQYQISNTDTCAEGLSPHDEYRIIQTKLEDAEGAPRQYFDVPMDENFTMVRQFDSYQVWRRDENKVKAKAW